MEWLTNSVLLHKGELQEKPSALKREHPALQNMEILNFFLLLWVIFVLLDPDPLTWVEFGSESRNTGSRV
jgi:hypothetical protein